MARLKDEKRRTLSSRTWLERQLSDPYVARAKREGFRSRAAYKLAEIDDKYKVLRPGGHVVDLGAAPGGWSEIAARRVGATEAANGRVVAELMAMSSDERAANPCIGAERADLVLAGCAILDAIRRAFPCPRLRVADRGLREGMLVEMMREDGVWGEA